MAYKGQPQDLQNVLLDDAFIMMEHGKMSLPDALNIGLSFLKLYQASPSFDYASKRLESDRLYKVSVIEHLNLIAKVSHAK